MHLVPATRQLRPERRGENAASPDQGITGNADLELAVFAISKKANGRRQFGQTC